MRLSKAIQAHFAGVFAGSFVVNVGLGYINSGLIGALEASTGWVGGFLIWTILALLSAPVGLLARFDLGSFFHSPSPVAYLVGVAASLLLMVAMHPAMYPSISLESNSFALLLVHVTAGLLGAQVWLWVEKPGQPE
ncbi:MAG: hypothetical protein AAGF13_10325 [Pseudomonadota bacterium]